MDSETSGDSRHFTRFIGGTRVAIVTGMHRIESRDLALHLARIGVSATALGVSHAPWLSVGASMALFFAAFTLTHDLAHGALGLSRRTNEIALAAGGLLTLTSGHAMRAMHLRHHARPLADDDLEGLGARLSPLAALRAGPENAIALRVAAWRASHGAGRTWQLGESIAALALGALALLAAPGPLAIYVAVVVVFHATASLWASHVPHNAPAAIVGLAAKLAFTRSPIFLSLAFHEVHHARPRIPCQQLGASRSPERARAARG